MVKRFFLCISLTGSFCLLFGQAIHSGATYTRQDSLRGSITSEREWWDLKHYELYVSVHPKDSSITGENIIEYEVIQQGQVMQIDLQEPLTISKVFQNNKELTFRRDGKAYFIILSEEQVIGRQYDLEIQYGGKPHAAINPPWDGGFVWKKDGNGRDFIATSCQGTGASIWWPCKDNDYDEPDRGIRLSINCPEKLVAVGNGRLKGMVKEKNHTVTYTWEVTNPINNYGVSINIGDYTNFKDSFSGEEGILDLDYWVLKDNLKKARIQFQQANQTLEALEHWFGPYPFYNDSYKLVEVPYLGMEHQSAIAYGNGYKNGYLTIDRSQTGWGLIWDYIIVHETAHEWFGNSITSQDPADLWIHEGFGSYAESLFIEYFNGKEAGSAYVRGLRPYIDNRESIIGDYEVNDRGEDVYEKAANMLHTIRQLVDNDSLWLEVLRGINKEFHHKIVTTRQIEDYISIACRMNLTTVFNQYLRDIRVPVLEYTIDNKQLVYRWTNCIEGFDMSVNVNVNDQWIRLKPETDWNRMIMPSKIIQVSLDDDFYVYAQEVLIDKAP